MGEQHGDHQRGVADAVLVRRLHRRRRRGHRQRVGGGGRFRVGGGRGGGRGAPGGARRGAVRAGPGRPAAGRPDRLGREPPAASADFHDRRPRSPPPSTSTPTCSRRWRAAFEDARSGDRVLYGFARHETTTTHLGSSTGVRLRWVQPTGTLELNAKSADLRRSSWGGLSTPDFRGVTVDDAGRVADPQAGVGAAHGRPAGRPVRHGAAADRGGRFHDQPGLERGGPARARGALRVLRARAAGPGSVNGSPSGRSTLAGDPSAAGLRVRAVRGRRPFLATRSRSSTTARRSPRVEIVTDGVINSTAAHPRVRRGVRRAVHPGRRQPAADRRRSGRCPPRIWWPGCAAACC